ncbi:MAG: right-handed parallel beta-helix repeat-containing protein [Pseudomonadota bacterium]
MTIHQFKPNIRHFSFFILSAFLYFGLGTAEAKELWVDILSLGGTCSDSRTREEVGPATPWCNLGPAGDQALAGDLVTVRRGTYTKLHTCDECYDAFVFEVVNSGTSTDWITFRALPGETVVISGDGGVAHGIGVLQNRNFGEKPQFIAIEGFEVRDFGPEGFCTWVRSTSDVVLRDLDVHGCSLGAVELHDTARVTVEDSRIHDNPMSGWTSAVDLYRCREGHIIRRNLIWGNTDTNEAESEGHGIIMDVCKDYGGSAVIESNVIWENEGWCFVANWSDNGNVRNNTCYMNGKDREETGEIIIGDNNHRIYNNIAVPRPGRLGLAMKYGEGNTFEHNLVYGGDWLLTWPENLYYINADPMFANPDAWDFHLTAGSPAIDSGNDSNAASIDADGVPRPQDGSGLGYLIVDIGAYEYVPDDTGGDDTDGDDTGGSGAGDGGGSGGGAGGGGGNSKLLNR